MDMTQRRPCIDVRQEDVLLSRGIWQRAPGWLSFLHVMSMIFVKSTAPALDQKTRGILTGKYCVHSTGLMKYEGCRKITSNVMGAPSQPTKIRRCSLPTVLPWYVSTCKMPLQGDHEDMCRVCETLEQCPTAGPSHINRLGLDNQQQCLEDNQEQCDSANGETCRSTPCGVGHPATGSWYVTELRKRIAKNL